jgi:Secretion system C-terminal sorting domain/Beta-propeller repeat
MKKNILTIAVSITTLITFAQAPSFSWAKEINTKSVAGNNCIAKDVLNNIYVATNEGITKFDNAGTIIWNKKTGGASSRTYGIDLDATGNVYVAGTFSGSEDFDASSSTTTLTSNGMIDGFVLKLDGSGNFVWAKSFGASQDDTVYGLDVDAAGNVYTTGTYFYTVDFDPNAGVTNLTSTSAYPTVEMFISKLNTSGNLVWAKSIGSQWGGEEARTIAVDATGNIYTAGQFNNFVYPVDFDPSAAVYNLTPVGGTDVFVSKLDATGNFLWAKQFGGPDNDLATDITLDATGNVYCTGSFKGVADFDPSVSTLTLNSSISTGTPIVTSPIENSFVFKVTTAGAIAWAKGFETIGTAGNSQGYGIALDAAGNVYTTGRYADACDLNPSAIVFTITPISTYWSEAFVHKLDANGNFIWAVGMGGTSTDYGNNLLIDDDNNIYSTGYFQMAQNDFDPGTPVFALNPNLGGGYVHKLGTGPVGINEINNSSSNFNIYPNPSNEILNIKLDASNESHRLLVITDVLGQVVLSKTITENNTQLNISDFTKGIYFITVKSGDKMSTQKLIIN